MAVIDRNGEEWKTPEVRGTAVLEEIRIERKGQDGIGRERLYGRGQDETRAERIGIERTSCNRRDQKGSGRT